MNETLASLHCGVAGVLCSVPGSLISFLCDYMLMVEAVNDERLLLMPKRQPRHVLLEEFCPHSPDWRPG